MHPQRIRNVTLKRTYAERSILIDPDLAVRHARPSFTGRSLNPMVNLPLPLSTIVVGVDLLIVSHLHCDHFDAVESIPTEVPVLCQLGDKARIADHGFTQIMSVVDAVDWGGIRVTRRADVLLGWRHSAL